MIYILYNTCCEHNLSNKKKYYPPPPFPSQNTFKHKIGLNRIFIAFRDK